MQPFLTKQKALKISVFKAFLAEDMGLELRNLLAQTVETKGGLSLYSDGM